MDAILLGRADYTSLRGEIARAIGDQPTLPGVMDTVCDRLAMAFNAQRVWWATAGDQPSAHAFVPSRTATVATTDPPHLLIHVGELTGGRRLLSDDEALLDAVAVIAARRIDAIRLTLERYETQLREEEMQKLTAEAELKAAQPVHG